MKNRLKSYLKWLDKSLFDPKTSGQFAVIGTVVLLVFISIFELSITVQYPEFVSRNYEIFYWLRKSVTLIFTIEILVRIALRPRPKDYLFSLNALVDILAILPSFIGFLVPNITLNLAWLRGLRIVRLLRAVTLTQKMTTVRLQPFAVLVSVAPYMAIAFSLKAMILYLEGFGYWLELSGLGTVISVVGFAIGVLLSTKISIAQNRMYTFEERLAHLVGSVEVAEKSVSKPGLMRNWLHELYNVIRNGTNNGRFEKINQRVLTELRSEIAPPVWISLTQNSRFILQRVKTKTPEAYDKVLINITIIYIGCVIVSVPGLTGLISSFVVVYVLGGLVNVIDSMDVPYDPSGEALVNSDLSVVEYYLFPDNLNSYFSEANHTTEETIDKEFESKHMV